MNIGAELYWTDIAPLMVRCALVWELLSGEIRVKETEKFGLPGVQIPPVNYSDIAKRIRSVIQTI